MNCLNFQQKVTPHGGPELYRIFLISASIVMPDKGQNGLTLSLKNAE